MAITAGIAAVAVAGTSVAVQANQQKIAAQKQQDALGDAKVAQQKMQDQQTTADNQRKAQESAATQTAFAATAASRQGVSGAAVPGAVTDQQIGTVGTSAAQATKKLIGS